MKVIVPISVAASVATPMSAELAAGNQKLGQPGDILLSVHARNECARQVGNDDNPVREVKVHRLSFSMIWLRRLAGWPRRRR
jgi:hypothetical protein